MASIPSSLDTHVHRWRIAEPRGPTSSGRCLLCGDERLFQNAPPEVEFSPIKRHTPVSGGLLHVHSTTAEAGTLIRTGRLS